MYAHRRPKRLVCLLCAAVAAALVANAAEAEEFSWHLSGGVSHSAAGDFDWDDWSVDATYFVRPVDDRAGPYALASFLDPTTHVSAAASRSDIGNPRTYELEGTYFLPGQRWYVGASYAEVDGIDSTPVFRRSDTHDYGAVAGRYLGPNTTLGVRLGRSEYSTDDSFCFITACVPVATDTTADSIGVEIFHVRRFRSLTYSLQGRVTYTDTEQDIELLAPPATPFTASATDFDPKRVYSVAGELFPTKRLGVRIGYSRLDDPFVDNDSYDVAATWFFKPRIAVQLAIGRTKIDVPATDDVDNAVVRFVGRL